MNEREQQIRLVCVPLFCPSGKKTCLFVGSFFSCVCVGHCCVESAMGRSEREAGAGQEEEQREAKGGAERAKRMLLAQNQPKVESLCDLLQQQPMQGRGEAALRPTL